MQTWLSPPPTVSTEGPTSARPISWITTRCRSSLPPEPGRWRHSPTSPPKTRSCSNSTTTLPTASWTSAIWTFPSSIARPRKPWQASARGATTISSGARGHWTGRRRNWPSTRWSQALSTFLTARYVLWATTRNSSTPSTMNTPVWNRAATLRNCATSGSIPNVSTTTPHLSHSLCLPVPSSPSSSACSWPVWCVTVCARPCEGQKTWTRLWNRHWTWENTTCSPSTSSQARSTTSTAICCPKVSW